ncbi:MAG: hypothetical protein ACRDOB_21545 [Streptosporangiaceae bacterium]
MANELDTQSAGSWPQVNSGPLITGGILIGIGAVVALAGLAVAGTHLVTATRAWIKELETPPSELARLKWEQAKTAASSGAGSWREHPNAKVRLVRRGGAPAAD